MLIVSDTHICSLMIVLTFFAILMSIFIANIDLNIVLLIDARMNYIFFINYYIKQYYNINTTDTERNRSIMLLFTNNL